MSAVLDDNVCDECKGAGTVPQVEWVSNCERDFDAPCAICEGKGHYDDLPMPERDDLSDDQLPDEPWPQVRPPNPPRADTGD
jgi:hypothetical protein